MYTLFLLCAVIGGTVFIFQFVMTLVGLGGDGWDVGHDVPDHFDLGHLHAGGGDVHDAHGHGSTFLFGIISVRTVVAALTFFGLAGIVSLSHNVAPIPAVAVSLAVGFVAMLVVHRLMVLLYSLGQDKTVRIERSVGASATVYVPIPPKKQGVGKVQLRLQERIVECAAMTSGPETLPTGARVVVTNLIGPTTLEVELSPERDEAEAPIA